EFLAQPDVLVQQDGPESEIETAIKHRAWEFVGRCRIAAAACVEHVEHDLCVESRLHSQHHHFCRSGHRVGGQKIVQELHRLSLARLVAHQKYSSDDF